MTAAYKFLTEDGLGLFSRFPWPLPAGEPGAWVESEVDPCRTGIHACRAVDLPYWVGPVLYEMELEGPVTEGAVKIVAPRGRLVRRIDAWDTGARQAYGEMCVARALELVASAPERLQAWAPAPELAGEPARIGFVAARIAEELGGGASYLAERQRQSEWLVASLALD
jgi:hypothetical protein